MGRPRKNNDSALTQKNIDKIFTPSEVKCGNLLFRW